MKYSIVLLLFAFVFITSTYAGNDYTWGQIGPNDYLISKDKVHKYFIAGLSVSTKYVFKQKSDLNAYTITCIKVNDKMKKNGATAELTLGGPGSKGATIKFTSQRGHGISDDVLIYGR